MSESRYKLKRENYLETHLRMMIWVGLSRPLSTHPIINALFIFRAIFIAGAYVVLITGCIAHMKIVNKYDLLASSMNVLQLIVYGMGTLHVCYYYMRNEGVHCLIKKIRETFRFSSNTGHFTMDEPARMDKRRSVGWTALCSLAATCWFVLAMAKGDDPVPVWAPVNLQESPYYEIDTLLQFIGQFMIGAVGGCFGSFYISVLSLFRHQFEMLSCSLEHAGPLAALKMRRRVRDENERTSSPIASKDSILYPRGGETKISHQCECCTEEFKRFFATFEKRRSHNALTPLEIRVYEEELYDTLKDCIVHHQDIVQLKDAVEDFFGPVIFIRFVLSTMMLCFTIYSSTKFTAKEDFSPTDMRFISLVEYYMIAVGELFLFCYVPDHLFRTSMAIPDVAFERIPWHGGSVTKKFISTLKIFHLSATKPTCLRTPFYIVNLNILRIMFRTSFSFYTLLRKMQDH